MANIKNTATFDPSTYASLSGALSSSLNSSPTAYTPNTAPTPSDLQQQVDLMNLQTQAQTAQQTKLKAAVYGTAPAPPVDLNNLAPSQTGPVMRTLMALRMPAQVIQGAVEDLTNTKTNPDPIQNIFDKVRQQSSYGDTLRRVGVTSPWAAIPLGFALDVALDPVNWLTAGTDAIIPKLASGLKEGGTSGLAAAVEAAGKSKLSTLSNLVPFLSSETRTGLGASAATAEDAYRALANKPSVIEEALARSQKLGPFEQWQQGGSALANFFTKYIKPDPAGWLAQSMQDEKQVAAETASGVRSPLNQLLEELGGRLELGNGDAISQQLSNLAKSQTLQDSRNLANAAAFNPPAPGVLSGMLPGDVENQMSQVASDIQKTREAATAEIKANMNDTGAKWYDDLIKKVNANPYTAKFWQGMQALHGIFKIAKVPLNPPSFVNSIFSHATMTAMFGQPIWDARYLSAVEDAYRLFNGGALSEEMAAGLSPEIRTLLEQFPRTAEGAMGLNQSMIDASVARLLQRQTGLASLNSWKDLTGISSALNKASINVSPQDLQDAFQQLNDLRDFRNSGTLAIKAAQGAVPDLANQTTFISQDVLQGPVGATLEQWEETGTPGQKWLAGKLLGLQQTFNNTSSIYKVGGFLHWTTNGVDGPTLLRMSRYLKDLQPGDITFANGFYHLSPEAAMKAANLVGINYAAMPAGIRVLRNMPFLGSPFASFAAGALTKTIQAVAKNPESLNQITSAVQEIGKAAPETPQEKVALGGPYYNYLNRFERMKLPFMQDYPMYLNIARWFPYMSLNFFDTPDRKYDNTFGGNVAQVIDQLPILKTPEGQALYDYIIQPYILNESHPTGQFGQDLYPQATDSLGEKVQTVATNTLGNFVPNWTPLIGFRANQLMNAVQGKNSQGIITTSVPAGNKILEWLGSMVGVPVTQINLPSTISSTERKAYGLPAAATSFSTAAAKKSTTPVNKYAVPRTTTKKTTTAAASSAPVGP